MTVAIEAGDDYRFLPGFRGRVGLGRHIGILHDRVTEIKTCDARGSCRAPLAAAKTAAKPLDNACPVRTTLECRPSTRTATDGPGRCAYSYGSDAPQSKRVPERRSHRG